MSDKEFSMQRFILSTHLWLGLCGVVCTWGTFVLLHQSVPVRYLAFVLAGTMTIYTYHGYRNQRNIQQNSGKSSANPAYIKIILLAGSIATLILYLMLSQTSQIILLLPVCMSLLYVLPNYHGKRLKDYPFIKIIAIVVAWTMVTYLIPVWNIPEWWTQWGYNFLMLDRMLFFFTLAIPFDIRDMQYDQDHELKTIPNTIGLDNSQNLALFSLFLAAGFMSMATELLNIHGVIKIGILLVYILIGLVVIQLKKNPGSGFYAWVIDGFLLLYGFIIIFLSR